MDKKLAKLMEDIKFYLEQAGKQDPETNLHLFYANRAELAAYDVEERCKKLAAQHMMRTAKRIIKMNLKIQALTINLSNQYYSDANRSFYRDTPHWSKKGQMIREALE